LNDPTFSSLLLRTIAVAHYNGTAAIGECITTVYQINECDFERQYKKWKICVVILGK